jgi:hypothetical protein
VLEWLRGQQLAELEPRTPGPKPDVFERVVAEMRETVREHGAEYLRAAKEEQMAGRPGKRSAADVHHGPLCRGLGVIAFLHELRAVGRRIGDSPDDHLMGHQIVGCRKAPHSLR